MQGSEKFIPLHFLYAEPYYNMALYRDLKNISKTFEKPIDFLACIGYTMYAD